MIVLKVQQIKELLVRKNHTVKLKYTLLNPAK